MKVSAGSKPSGLPFRRVLRRRPSCRWVEESVTRNSMFRIRSVRDHPRSWLLWLNGSHWHGSDEGIQDLDTPGSLPAPIFSAARLHSTNGREANSHWRYDQSRRRVQCAHLTNANEINWIEQSPLRRVSVFVRVTASWRRLMIRSATISTASAHVTMT
jgi:hypothetical protein